MTRNIRRVATGFAVLSLAPCLAPSALSQEHQHREVGAHVHGAAEISFVVSGNELLVDLDSPLMNIVGFEHAPAGSPERKAADRAIALLNNPASIAIPSPAAECMAAKPAIVLPFDAKPETGAAGHPVEAGGGAHGHMDVEASYAFVCKNIARLDQIDVAALRTFPGIKTARVVFLGPKAQLSRQLGSASSVFNLK